MVATPEHEIPIRERAAVTVRTAAQFCGISRSRLYELMSDGTIDGRIVGGRRVILVESLMRLVGEAPTARKAA